MMKLTAIFATEEVLESFGISEEGISSRILELLDSAATGKVKSELWNDVIEKEYSRRNYL